MKFNDTLTEIVRLDLEIGSVPALMGEPGIGKSSFVEGLALAMDTKAFVLPCNQLADKADLTGARLVPTDDGKSYQQVFYPHSVVQQAIEYARANPREWPILFFDEINRTTPDVTSAVLTVITLRQLGKENLPENLRIVVAGNDKGNVVALDDASISRFSIYHVEPDAQTLIGLLGAELNPYVKAVLMRFPTLVFQKSAPTAILVDGTDDDDDDSSTANYADLLDAGEEMLQLTTPRTIHSMSRWLNVVTATKLQEYLQTQMITEGRETTMLNEVIEAHIGNTEFATHLVAEIAVGLNAGTSTQAAAMTVPKPNCFASLKRAQTVTDLEDLIESLNDHEKSGSLVYALYERVDNKIIIEQLAQQTTVIESDHNRRLVQLAAQSMLHDPNVTALFGTTTPVGESTKLMLSAFMS
jgi:MoxR-like ATPase